MNIFLVCYIFVVALVPGRSQAIALRGSYSDGLSRVMKCGCRVYILLLSKDYSRQIEHLRVFPRLGINDDFQDKMEAEFYSTQYSRDGLYRS